MFPKPMVACGSVIVETFKRGGICTDVYDYLVRGVTGDGGSDGSGGSGGGMVQGYELLPTSLPKHVVTEGLGCLFQDVANTKLSANARLIQWLEPKGNVYLSDASGWVQPPHLMATSPK